MSETNGVDAIVAEIRRRSSARCPGCGRRKAGDNDALCPPCWKLVSTDLRECYRLVWRLVHASLVSHTVQVTLERLIGESVRTKLQPPQTVPQVKPPRAARVSPKSTTPKAPRSIISDERLAALPAAKDAAVSATEFAEQFGGVSPVAMGVWLLMQRRKGTVNAIAITSPKGRRVTFRYWRSA